MGAYVMNFEGECSVSLCQELLEEGFWRLLQIPELTKISGRESYVFPELPSLAALTRLVVF